MSNKPNFHGLPWHSRSPFIWLQHVLPQAPLSRLVGRVAATELPWVSRPLISRFARFYQVDMQQALQPDLGQYRSFNAFFTRPLQASARPVDMSADAIVSPADGVISQIGQIVGDEVLQAKGQTFSVSQLIGDAQLARPFEHGQFATVYLSPRDYHRVHMPLAGRLTETIYIPGKLFSVNALTAQHVPALFARNERLVCLFDLAGGQRMAVVLVGAMIVAGIECVATGRITPGSPFTRQTHDLQLDKGAELGRFYLGSTAIVLLPQDSAHWLDSLKAGDSVQMGTRMGQLEGVA